MARLPTIPISVLLYDSIYFTPSYVIDITPFITALVIPYPYNHDFFISFNAYLISSTRIIELVAFVPEKENELIRIFFISKHKVGEKIIINSIKVIKYIFLYLLSSHLI